MIKTRPIFYQVYVTLEAKSAHAIHTGHGDTTHDSLIVRDANGLPTLLGTSLAGILRHQFTQQYGDNAANALFGFAQGDEGQSSWLNVGWGLVHNSKNQPIQGLLSPQDIQQDFILAELLLDKPIVHHRVQLNDMGAAVGAGKFDVTLAPAGVRYTSMLGYWCDGSNSSRNLWQQFLNLLTAHPIRLGKGARNGYGLFHVVAACHAQYDLRTPEGKTAYQQRSRTRGDTKKMQHLPTENTDDTNIHAVLKLQAEGHWRVGGGEPFKGMLNRSTNERLPDTLPMNEQKIIWQGNQASIGQHQYVLPASAVKGAVRHRVAFHYNCLNGLFGEACADTNDNPAVKALFGFGDGDNNEQQAGILALHDAYITKANEQALMHNKIDRFTAGVMNGALFEEMTLYRNQLDIRIDVLDGQKPLDVTIKQALQLTLEDIAKGWLPLGAGSSRGLGVFIDKKNIGVQWSDAGQWLQTKA